MKKHLKKFVTAAVGLLLLTVALGLSLLLLVTHPVIWLLWTVGSVLIGGLALLVSWARSPD